MLAGMHTLHKKQTVNQLVCALGGNIEVDTLSIDLPFNLEHYIWLGYYLTMASPSVNTSQHTVLNSPFTFLSLRMLFVY